MNPLYLDELTSGTAVSPTPAGPATSAPGIGIPSAPRAVQTEDRQDKFLSSPLGKFFAALEGFGAGVQGRTPMIVSLQEKRRKEKQEQQIMKQQEVSAFLADMKNMRDLSADMDEDGRTNLSNSLSAKWAEIDPDYAQAVQAVTRRPELANMEKYAAYLPAHLQEFARKDPKGFMKWSVTKEGMEAINTAADAPHIRTARKKLEGITSFPEKFLPKEIVDRMMSDGVVTDDEILSAQASMPEKYRFTDDELSALKRDTSAYAEYGVLHGDKKQELLKTRAKEGSEAAITKQAAEYANKSLGVGVVPRGYESADEITDIYWKSLTEEEKKKVFDETGMRPPEMVEAERTSIEADPEWHRRRAEFYRQQGRDDLADKAIKQADELEEKTAPDKGRAAQAAMIERTMIRDGVPEAQAKQTGEMIASGRLAVATDPNSGNTRIIDLAAGRVKYEFSTPISQVGTGATATPEGVDPTQATGAMSVLKNAANVIFDFVGKDIPYPKTAEASNALKNLQISTIAVFQEAGSWKPSVATTKFLSELTQSPRKFFDGDKLSRSRMESTRRMAQQEVERIDRTIATGALRPNDRSDYVKKKLELEQLEKNYEMMVSGFDKAPAGKKYDIKDFLRDKPKK